MCAVEAKRKVVKTHNMSEGLEEEGSHSFSEDEFPILELEGESSSCPCKTGEKVGFKRVGKKKNWRKN